MLCLYQLEIVAYICTMGWEIQKRNTLPDVDWSAKKGYATDVLGVVATCLFQNRTQEQGPLQSP
jgi:hypothetical protein